MEELNEKGGLGEAATKETLGNSIMNTEGTGGGTVPEPRLNLYQKLVEIRKQVDYLQKTSKGYNYKYADETAILRSIRPKMDELGVFLEFQMMEPQLLTDKFVQVGFEFTWVDADDPSVKITKSMFLQTTVGDVQKLGGLCTYANRFFLYKWFNVPTSELDPDVYEQQTSGTLTAKQVSYLERLINGDLELRNRMLEWCNVDNYADIPQGRYQPILDTVKKHRENNNG